MFFYNVSSSAFRHAGVGDAILTALFWCVCIYGSADTTLPHEAAGTADKGKGKVPRGCLFGGAGHLWDQIFHAPRSQALALCR